MSKTPSKPDPNANPVFELFKKCKRFKHFKLYAGVLGFIFASISVICCYFYLDYRAVVIRIPFQAQSERFISKAAAVEDQRVDFLGEKAEECDVFEGNWMWDENYPLYQSKDCRFLDEGFRCSENGRPDLLYTKWRWPPKGCNLPRGGDWKTGGNCHLETLPELGSSLSPSDSWDIVKIANSVLSAHLNTSESLKVEVLNITHMTAQRRDGHSSIYYQDPKKGPAPLHRQDCSNWCLPGVLDTWNELLYALFLKHVTTSSCNSSRFQEQV